MYETIYLTPKAGEGKAMVEAIFAHKAGFHAEGAHESYLQYTEVGAHAGDFVWIMGPLTFTDLDTRPSGETHDEDWSQKVMPHIEEAHTLEYWHKVNDLSYTPKDTTLKTPMLHIRYWDIKAGEWETFKGVLSQVQKVFEAEQYPGSWSIYYSEFNTGNKRDVAAVSRFENWASMDEDDTWVKDFEALHGEGSWKEALETMNAVSHSMFEEIRSDVKKKD